MGKEIQFTPKASIIPERVKDNVQFMEWIMTTGGQTGGLKQVFIIDAINKWCDYIIDNKEQVIKEMEKSMVSGEGWVRCAEELREYLDAWVNKAITQ